MSARIEVIQFEMGNQIMFSQLGSWRLEEQEVYEYSDSRLTILVK